MTEFANLRFGPMPRMFPLEGTVRTVELLDGLEVSWNGGGFTVPTGFAHDGPSIPNRLRGLIYYTHRLLKPSIAHDYLFVAPNHDGFTRVEADALFLAGLEVEGVGWLRRKTMWSAVRAGGWTTWE